MTVKKTGGQNATGFPVTFRTRQEVGRDGPENAACRAVAFSGTSPEFDRGKCSTSDCVPT
ncbi:hypothetical protein Taro_019208 [Colocasia esculenta]|uniref:Uncharacterized protein n=1 Tax=Colocasia esculenta TaxID=4460 RepID=A0A843UVR0_COLES|nr:hypothetical protein [Colocasia esculenta]